MYRYRFAILLGTLVLMMLAMPLVVLCEQDVHGWVVRGVLTGTLVIMLISAVFAVARTRRTMIVALVLAVPPILMRLVNMAVDGNPLRVGEHLWEIVFFSYVIAILIRHLFRARRVSIDMICAAVCTYILLGTLWAMLYSTLDIMQPGSFAFPLGETLESEALRFDDERLVYAQYFSFVTMTTLGYGDVVPVSPMARMLAVLEALIGQFFLAVLVARLVGITISQSLKRA